MRTMARPTTSKLCKVEVGLVLKPWDSMSGRMRSTEGKERLEGYVCVVSVRSTRTAAATPPICSGDDASSLGATEVDVYLVSLQE